MMSCKEGEVCTRVWGLAGAESAAGLGWTALVGSAACMLCWAAEALLPMQGWAAAELDWAAVGFVLAILSWAGAFVCWSASAGSPSCCRASARFSMALAGFLSKIFKLLKPPWPPKKVFCMTCCTASPSIFSMQPCKFMPPTPACPRRLEPSKSFFWFQDRSRWVSRTGQSICKAAKPGRLIKLGLSEP